MKKIIFLLLLVALLWPSGGTEAAYNTFVANADVKVYISNLDINLTMKSGANLESYVVNAGNLQVVMSTTSTLTLESSDRRSFTVSPSLTWDTFTTYCGNDLSNITLKLPAGTAATTITITPSTGVCSSGGGGSVLSSGSGGGGGGSAAQPPPVPTPPVAPEPTPHPPTPAPEPKPTKPTPKPTKKPAPTLTIAASPKKMLVGNSATIAWTSKNTTSCKASSSWKGTKDLSGSESTGVLSKAHTYEYVMLCKGPGGSVSRKATIVVTKPPAPKKLPAPKKK